MYILERGGGTIAQEVPPLPHQHGGIAKVGHKV